MPYTITITNDSPQALAYVEKAKKLDFVKVTEIKKSKKVALSQSLDFTAKEKELQRKINRGLQELEDFRAGKIQLKRLEDVLNEI